MCMVDIKAKRRILPVLLLAWMWRWQTSKIIAMVHCYSLFDFDLNEFTVNLECFIVLPLKSGRNVQIDSPKSDWSSYFLVCTYLF